MTPKIRRKLLVLTILLFFTGTAFAAMTNTIKLPPKSTWWKQQQWYNDEAQKWAREVEDILENWTIAAEADDKITFPTNGLTIDNATNGKLEINEGGDELILTFGSNTVTMSSGDLTSFSFGTIPVDLDQFKSNATTYTLPTTDGSPGQQWTTNGSGVLSWAAAGAGTFTGGSITGDVTLSDGVDIFSSTTTAHTNSIGGYADAGAYKDVLRWTNGAAVAAVLGASDVSLAITSTGLNVTTAGVVTGVTDLTATGTMTINSSGTSATNIGAGTYAGAITLGNNLASLAIGTSAWDVSSAGAFSGVTTISMSDDLTMATGKGVKSSTTTAHSVGMYGYDTDGAYVGALVVTNSATPATVLGNTNGTTAISSSDWTVSTAGNMAGIGTITNDGLITASGGLTLTGTTSVNDSATTSTTSIGGGTTTGAITVGGTGTQTISVGNGAGVKTVAVGSDNTTSTTTILGGSGGVNIAHGAYDDPVNIAGSTATGTVTVGGTGTQQIDVGTGAGAKTVGLGSDNGASATTIKAGTGDLTMTSIDDVTLNGGSTDSILNLFTNNHANVINVGTGTAGNIFHIGDNDTLADTGTIGSAKDTWALAGISVTIGSTGTSSATAIQSGSGEVKINESINQPVSIATGTSTGTVEIGNGDTAQTVTIANGAGVKTVALGSTDTTSVTTISSGSGGLALNGPVAINTSKGTNTINIGDGTTTGAITIGGTGTQTIAIGNGAGIKTVAVGSINSTSSTAISSGTGDLDLIATAALDIDAGTTFDVLAAGAFSIDGSNAASNVSLATDSAGDNLTVSVTGATDSHLILSSTGTSADAASLLASGIGGGISIDTANGKVAIVADGAENGDIEVDSEDDMTVTVGGDFAFAVTGALSLGDSDVTNVGDIACDDIVSDASGDIMIMTKTIVKTIDCNVADSTDDFQFDDTQGNTTEQQKSLGAIIPAYALIVSAQVRCFETVTSSAQMSIDVGTSAGGNEILSAGTPDTANDIIGSVAADSPEVAASNSAVTVYVNATPDANWDTLVAGRWAVMITYVDYGAAYTQKNP